jgi:hypothetical protein
MFFVVSREILKPPFFSPFLGLMFFEDVTWRISGNNVRTALGSDVVCNTSTSSNKTINGLGATNTDQLSRILLTMLEASTASTSGIGSANFMARSRMDEQIAGMARSISSKP